MKQTILLLSFIIIFSIGIYYLIIPGPVSIEDIPPLPNSLKSDEPGDTVQVPNVSAYFSQWFRRNVTKFYKDNIDSVSMFNIKVPSIRLNHPPEEAYQYIRDQQTSSYLEEYVYPMRYSLFVNGFEPFDETGKGLYKTGNILINVNSRQFRSKTTLRYYPSKVFWRIVIYLAAWGLGALVFIVLRKSLIEGKENI